MQGNPRYLYFLLYLGVLFSVIIILTCECAKKGFVHPLGVNKTDFVPKLRSGK